MNLCQQNDKFFLGSDKSLVDSSLFIGIDCSRYVNQWDLACLPIQHFCHYSAALICSIVTVPRLCIPQWAKEAIMNGHPLRRLGFYTGWSSIQIPSGWGTWGLRSSQRPSAQELQNPYSLNFISWERISEGIVLYAGERWGQHTAWQHKRLTKSTKEHKRRPLSRLLGCQLIRCISSSVIEEWDQSRWKVKDRRSQPLSLQNRRPWTRG